MAESSSSSGSDSDVEPTDPSMWIIPGPYRWEVLRQRTQKGHISQRVWNTEHVRKIKTRRGKPQGGPPTGAIPQVVEEYLRQAGFIHVARMQHIQAGEFHHSGDLRISFLDRHYTRWTDHEGNHAAEIYFTKAHIARMLGTWLLADKSGGSNFGCRLVPLLGGGFEDIGRFSWGSAILTHLFRNLCEVTDARQSDMGGCHILLQIWAWIRFPPIAPPLPPHPQPGTHYGCQFNAVQKFKPHEVTHYRETLDTLCRDEVVWQPYIEYEWLDVTPEQQYLWLAPTPIIYFHTVEACQPNRCMRQFGLNQPIPEKSRKLRGIHDHTLRGKVEENWRRKLMAHIDRWNTRIQHIVLPPPLYGLMSPNHEYMEWFRERGKRYISRRAAKIGRMAEPSR
ncbi:serine/threonine-protein phosphatase 7 long form homolog [Gastrolobium bilobum]|uniref:serine/threonine-protein phosphatase 7 long form homolog n=1 Tax=Gastrolobium bilobum TaxID=150636 RepID=UPI002AAF5E08|nr:serine/threonine-protein phosphatase 7 long form homolog [Gastrolobium bilobum]